MNKITCKRQMPEINGNVWCQFAVEEKSECDKCCKTCDNKCEKECIFSKRNENNLD